jgi:outer membrane receptor protein involved in Fe transport
VNSGSEDPTAPVKGYVAKTSISATKTGTPLVETPQSISVITADQLKAQDAQTSDRHLATHRAWFQSPMVLIRGLTRR